MPHLSTQALPSTPFERIVANANSKHIPGLDALRAISALLVVFYHCGVPHIPASLGVTIFFVISGFLITWILLKEHDKTGTISLRKFYARRSFRIFPAFYVFWGLVVAIKLIRHTDLPWGQAVSSFFYVCNYYQGTHGYPSSALSRTWSLGVEEQFYLLWPPLFRMFADDQRKLVRGLMIAIGSVWALRFVLTGLGVHEAYIYTAFETRCDQIIVGCLIAVSMRRGYFVRFWNAICRHPGMLALTLAALAASLPLHYHVPNYRNLYGFVVESLLAGLLIVQVLGVEWRPLGWLDSKPLVYLGSISYSTYLYHAFMSSWTRRFPLPLEVILTVAIAYIFAGMSYALVERPFLRMRDRVLSGAGQREAAPIGTA